MSDWRDSLRWPMGDDFLYQREVAAEEGNDNTCEHGGDHPAPAGHRFCSAECRDCEGTPFDDTKEGCAYICYSGPAGPEVRE